MGGGSILEAHFGDLWKFDLTVVNELSNVLQLVGVIIHHEEFEACFGRELRLFNSLVDDGNESATRFENRDAGVDPFGA